MTDKSKYSPLSWMLIDAAHRGATELTVTFEVLDREIPGGLPISARKYPGWWANSGEPHSSAWREVGWLVDGVNQSSGMWVHFRFQGEESALADLDEREPRRIGFVLPEARPESASVTSLSARREEQRREIDRIELKLIVQWRRIGRVTLGDAGRLMFPTLPSGAGLYRFTMCGAPTPVRPRVYIGEAEILSRCMAGYRTPGPTQTMNIRINATLIAHLRSGGRAEIAVATDCGLSDGGNGPPAQLPLSRKSVRLLAERAAVVAASQAGDVELENACETADSALDSAA